MRVKKILRIENIVITVGLILVIIPVGFSFYAGYSQARAVEKWEKIIPPNIARQNTAQKRNGGHVLESVDIKKLVEAAPAEGESAALIKILAINVSLDIIEGATWANLAKGPVRLSGSSLIGADGTTVISGHRTMYGAPFRDLDKVAPGDTIELYTKKAAFVYRVVGVKSVNPTDTSDVTEDGKPQLILSTCDPIFSAKKRLLVISELAKAKPLK